MDHSAYSAWIDEAVAQAELSWAQGGIPIGAVLIEHADALSAGRVVASGHNQRVQRSDPTAHAEIECVRNAGRRRDWHRLTLVSTLSPCAMCSGTAVLFRFPRVIVGENLTFQGAEDVMRKAGIAVHVVNDARCIALMQRMQRERPDLWAEDIGR